LAGEKKEQAARGREEAALSDIGDGDEEFDSNETESAYMEMKKKAIDAQQERHKRRRKAAELAQATVGKNLPADDMDYVNDGQSSKPP
jgi:hypothetical protein